MKKFILSAAIALLTATTSFAQFDCGDFDLGAGFRSYLGRQCFGTPMYGAYLGTNFTFNELLGPIDLGLGANFGQTINRSAWSTTGEVVYIGSQDFQFPLYLRGRLEVGGACELFLSFGPTFNAGVTLKTRYKEQFYSSEGVQWDLYKTAGSLSNPSYYQYDRFDVMLDTNLGVIIGEHLKITAGFAWGCIPRCKVDWATYGGSADPQSHNWELNVGAAFIFAK